jgi:hypothetical protein
VTRYRWTKANDAAGYITTGHNAYASEAAAIAGARRDVRFVVVA